MIGFLGNKKIQYNKIRTDNNGNIAFLETEIDEFLLLNLYNPNTEAEKVRHFFFGFSQKCFFRCLL